MVSEYLIQLVEDFCKENNLDISLIYKKMAKEYQDIYGINIDYEMRSKGEYDIVKYLEERDIIYRYVYILNGLRKCIQNNWDLELDKL